MATLKERMEAAAVALAEAKRALADKQREFDDVFRETQGKKRPRSPKLSEAEPDSAAALPPDAASLETRILAALQSSAKARKYREVADEVKVDAEIVRVILYRLKKAGKVAKPGRGVWQAVSQATG